MNADLLLEQIEQQRNSLSTDRLDLSFGEIMRMYQDGDLIIRPAFQRYFRWNDEQKTRFIESILLGIPIPPIFVAANGDGVWELVDGLQRTSTMVSFFGVLQTDDEGLKGENNWKLLEGDKIPALEGFSYKELPEVLQRNLKRATCRVEILNWNKNYDMRFELFNRLNTGGSPLTAQEVRNCLYRDISPIFNDFLKRISSNQDFLDLLDLDENLIKQLYHEELALRFVSLYKNKENIKHGLAQHMTLFMKDALESKNFDYKKYEDIFNNVFKLLKPLGKDVFRKKGRLVTTTYDVITIGIAENYNQYKNKSTEFIKNKIAEQSEAINQLMQSSKNNSQKDRIINRLKEAQRIFNISKK